MNVLFVSYGGFASNGAAHIINLANALADTGVETAVAVPRGLKELCLVGSARFRPLTHESAISHRFADGRGPDVIHAWTPRQAVAKVTRRLAEVHGSPYLVHLEDNEHAISAAFLSMPVEELLARAAAGSSLNVPRDLSHPADMRRFLEAAAGVTVLTDRLLEFKPSHIPGLEIWPAAEDDLFMPQQPDPILRSKLGIPDDAHLLVYHGNVHAANVAEVRSLYLALGALCRRDVKVSLVRLGADCAELLPPELTEIEHVAVRVPFQPRSEIPRYLALAEMFVQPGRPDPFNEYRFPSKLPEFFAMGRPVVLPAANVGLYVKHEEEALVLRRGDALEIADAIGRVIADRGLAQRLGAGGRAFYERTMSWRKSAAKLLEFYERILDGGGFNRFEDDVRLRRVAKRYAPYRPDASLSYATVEDYSDSVERLAALATLNQDMKDAQRPWVFKTVLGSIPRGGRLLEIGAGDPWVADLLSRLGYEVVVVDPYDGRDRGPDRFDAIKAQFPRVKFLRGLFPQAVSALPDRLFDCIYSISVLEHLPTEAIDEVFRGIALHSRTPASPTVHAIDHVLLGEGAEEHLERLRRMVRVLGFGDGALAEVLARLKADPEAYFLSAEAHNRWRGSAPYRDFPMRRCVSVQICCPAGGVARDTRRNPGASVVASPGSETR
jgi:glycosyltransferase involved in cell wall biosynthesis